MSISPPRKRIGWVDAFLIVAAVSLVGHAVSRYSKYGLAFNYTASIPWGLYLVQGIQPKDALSHGDIVCWRYADVPLFMDRNYAPAHRRICKPVAGLVADSYWVANDRLLVSRGASDVPVVQAQIANKDSVGRQLPLGLPMRGVIPEGKVLVLAPEVATGMDSRYTGLLGREVLKERLHPIWVAGTKSGG